MGAPYPGGQLPQTPTPAPPSAGGRTTWVILAGVLTTLAVVAATVFLLLDPWGDEQATAGGSDSSVTSGDEDGDQEDADGTDTEEGSGSGEESGSDEPSEGDETGAEPEEEEPEEEAAEEPEARVCWDGTPAQGVCDLSSAEAGMWAFGFTREQCGHSGGHDHNVDSFSCYRGAYGTGVRFHLATYRDQASRASRLSDYGSCTPSTGQRITCGPTDTSRWVRTYRAPAGILFYASSTRPQALAKLPQRSFRELKYGVPESEVDW
jgi:hypothetical protein